MTTLIEQLASAKGIANDYVDAWGNPAQVTLESKAAMLAAMGYKVDDEVALQAQLEEEKRQHWQRPLDPVVVVRTGEAISLELRLPIELVNEELTWEVATEQGETVKGTLVPVDGEMVGVAHFGDVEYQAYRVAITADLPLGYHELTVKKA
ncbi:MAG: hypothetical protein ACMV0F_00030, partial [Trichlorobacter sp.]